MTKPNALNPKAKTLSLINRLSKKPLLAWGFLSPALVCSLCFCLFFQGLALAQDDIEPFSANQSQSASKPTITRAASAQQNRNAKPSDNAENDSPLAPSTNPSLGQAPGQAPKELTTLREGESGGAKTVEETGRLRERALREVALSSAILAGARWRYERILSEIVAPREKLLDELFDFKALVSDNGKLYLIPPVATWAGEAIRLADSRTALGQDKSYSLISKARLAGVAPDWRHYLMTAPQGPPEIHKALRPKGGAELKKWKKEVDRGWKIGLEQADRVFASNVAELSRDYVGMMIFKRLVFEDYARQAGTHETITDLEVKEREIIFKKTLYQLVGQDGFVKPKKAP